MLLLETLCVFAPAIAGNMAPSVAAMTAKRLGIREAAPIWPALLGDHKTWRGAAAGIIAGVVTAWVLHVWYVLDNGWVARTWLGGFYSRGNWWLPGLLMGLGAIGGDAAKSLIKRRMDIKPGGPWWPWDAVDWTLGVTVTTLPFFWWHGQWEFGLAGCAVIFWLAFCLHRPLSRLFHELGLKDVPH